MCTKPCAKMLNTFYILLSLIITLLLLLSLYDAQETISKVKVSDFPKDK